MSSFYDVLILEKKRQREEKQILHIVTDEQLESFKIFGNFLDEIPEYNKREEAECLLVELHNYAIEFIAYEQTYKDKEEQINMSDKVKSDLSKAKAFRATLNDYPLLQEQYEYVKKKGRRMTPYLEMIVLVEKYIDDLETKTFRIAPKKNYINFCKKPSKENLKNYLKTLVRKYAIDNTDSFINDLIKKFNDTVKYNSEDDIEYDYN